MAEPCGHRRSVTVPGGPLVVAGVSGSPGSVRALRYAADLLGPPARCRPGPGARVGAAWRRSARTQICRPWSCAGCGSRTPGSGCAARWAPRSVASRAACGPGRWCCAADRPARSWSAWPASPATCWSSAPAARTALTRLVCCPGRPSLPGSRPLPGAGRPRPRPGPASRPRPARLGTPPRGLDPGRASLPQPDAVTPTHQTASPPARVMPQDGQPPPKSQPGLGHPRGRPHSRHPAAAGAVYRGGGSG